MGRRHLWSCALSDCSGGRFLGAARQKDQICESIKNDLNKLHHARDEFVAEVFLEMALPAYDDWREQSGLVVSGAPTVAPNTVRRVWGDSGYRVFLSHKAEVKSSATELKDALKVWGISAFVAHVDIHPTKEWQNEIEAALSSMQGFVALLTPDFHDSLWTDQEVGFALARSVPIIALKLGTDPYGFIGKFQALSCGLPAAPREIARLLIKHSPMIDTYISALEKCDSFSQGNILAELLPSIDALSAGQAERLVSAFNGNPEIRHSFGFNGRQPAKYGAGIVPHLERLTGNKYRISDEYELNLVNVEKHQ